MLNSNSSLENGLRLDLCSLYCSKRGRTEFSILFQVFNYLTNAGYSNKPVAYRSFGGYKNLHPNGEH